MIVGHSEAAFPRSALICYLWGSHNAGDMAICLGAAQTLSDLGCKISFVSRYAESQAEYIHSSRVLLKYFPNATVIPGFFDFSRDRPWYSRLNSYLRGFLTVYLYRSSHGLREAIKEADVVFLNGGNLLRCNNITDFIRTRALLFPIKLAKKLGRRTACLPQSTAKSRALGSLFLKEFISNFDWVAIRESESLKALSQYGEGSGLFLAPDMAFFLTEPNDENEVVSESSIDLAEARDAIGVVVRGTTLGDLGELGETEKLKYLSALVESLRDRKENVVIVVQTRKDSGFAQQLFSALSAVKSMVTLVEEYDPIVLRAVYSNMKMVVSMRLHAAIIAMSATTPVVGFFNPSWGYKNSGILTDAGMPWTYSPLELFSLVENMLQSLEQHRSLLDCYIDERKSVLKNHIEELGRAV